MTCTRKNETPTVKQSPRDPAAQTRPARLDRRQRATAPQRGQTGPPTRSCDCRAHRAAPGGTRGVLWLQEARSQRSVAGKNRGENRRSAEARQCEVERGMVQGQGRGRHTFLSLFLLLQYLGLVGRSIPTKGPEERRHSPLVQDKAGRHVCRHGASKVRSHADRNSVS